MREMAKRKKLYEPGDEKPFRLSRSKVDLFLNCPRCFYLDRRLGISRPPGFPFNLNSAVDTLLKNEFDGYRSRQEPHPLMIEYEINAIPFDHPDLEKWRANFKGVSCVHPQTNLALYGAVDDIWIDDASGELIVVDYKATSKASEVTLDAEWQIGYKRQMEFYQWLLRQNGFDVSDTGYFVYCNGRRDLDVFEDRLEFRTKVIGYTGGDDWVEPTITSIHQLLNDVTIPDLDQECAFCRYALEASLFHEELGV